MWVFWKYEEEGEICSRGSEERCKLYGISSSFNLLYLVLIPVVSGRGPETKETVCERQTDIVRWTHWKGFGGLGDEVWCTVREEAIGATCAVLWHSKDWKLWELQEITP